MKIQTENMACMTQNVFIGYNQYQFSIFISNVLSYTVFTCHQDRYILYTTKNCMLHLVRVDLEGVHSILSIDFQNEKYIQGIQLKIKIGYDIFYLSDTLSVSYFPNILTQNVEIINEEVEVSFTGIRNVYHYGDCITGVEVAESKMELLEISYFVEELGEFLEKKYVVS